MPAGGLLREWPPIEFMDRLLFAITAPTLLPCCLKFVRLPVFFDQSLSPCHAHCVSGETGQRLADEWNCAFVECSAKRNDKVGTLGGGGARPGRRGPRPRAALSARPLPIRMAIHHSNHPALAFHADEAFVAIIREIERVLSPAAPESSGTCTLL